MAQTWSREELVSELDSAYSKLEALLDGVAEADAFDAVAVDAWTVHDVLAVRVWWAEAVAEWIGAGLRDEAPQTPAAGYKWTQTPALNQSVVDASIDIPAQELRDRLGAAVAMLRNYIETLDDDQLLSVGVFLVDPDVAGLEVDRRQHDHPIRVVVENDSASAEVEQSALKSMHPPYRRSVSQ